MSTLGAMILSSSAASLVLGILEAADFSSEAHQQCFTAIQRLVTHGKSVELLTVKNELQDMGKLSVVGGEDYLIQIAESTPSASNALHYAEIVLDKSARRKITAQAKAIAKAVTDPELTLSEVVARAHSMSSVVTGPGPRNPFKHISEVDITVPVPRAITTGFAGLDSQINRYYGYPPGHMTVVRAATGRGKSTIMMQSALACVQGGGRVLYATFADLHERDIKGRWMRMLTGSSEAPYGDGLFPGEWQKQAEWLNGCAIDFYDVSEVEDGGTIEEFLAWATTRMTTNPWDRIFVDYAQEVRTSSKQAKGMMECQMECARVLNSWTRRHKTVSTVVGSQITTKDGETMTKWGRDWEEKAALVLTVTRPDPGTTQCRIEIDKNRFGPMKERATKVGIEFDSTRLLFNELEGF